jgi:DNA-binding beta-propeller fold protein YncE
VRSGITDGAGNYWAAGGAGGTFYAGNNGTAGVVQNAVANARVLNIVNGNLCFSTSSGTPGIYAFAGTPTATATASLLIGTGTGSSPYGFAISPAGTVAYVADDRSSGGIQRYDKTGGAWGLTYTLNSGPGVRGLTVSFSGPNPVVYATTTGNARNSLIVVTDTGVSSTATTLATANANEVFRGVAFTPAPEPATWVLLLAGGAVLAGRGRRHRCS